MKTRYKAMEPESENLEQILESLGNETPPETFSREKDAEIRALACETAARIASDRASRRLIPFPIARWAVAAAAAILLVSAVMMRGPDQPSDQEMAKAPVANPKPEPAAIGGKSDTVTGSVAIKPDIGGHDLALAERDANAREPLSAADRSRTNIRNHTQPDQDKLTDRLSGDVNQDGQVDVLDALALASAIVEASAPISSAHDLNQDGAVNQGDVDLLTQRIVQIGPS